MIMTVLLFIGISIILTCDAKPAHYLIETLDDNSLIGNAATDIGVEKTAIDNKDYFKKEKGGFDYCYFCNGHWM